MILHPARLVALLFAAASLPVFAQNVAVVNGKTIPGSRMEMAVKQLIARSQGRYPDNAEVRAELKEQLVNREVLAQEAEKLGLDKQPEVKAQLDLGRQEILWDALVGDFMKKHPATEPELNAEYARLKTELGDKQYHIRHILVEKEDEAKALIAKLKGGAKFEELAKQSKDGNTAGKGGELDWFFSGTMDPAIVNSVAPLQKGQVSENPVKTQYGYHVIRLDDVRPSQYPTMEEAKRELESRVQRRKFSEYGEGLRKKAKIQ